MASVFSAVILVLVSALIGVTFKHLKLKKSVKATSEGANRYAMQELYVLCVIV